MMLVRRVFAGVAVSIGAVMTAVWFAGAVNAQTDSPLYPQILTPERALAFIQAREQHLDYLPGEVLVKFKDGVTVVGQQRALLALRSRPAVSELQWIGDVALLTDQRERDATILAAQLSIQPEVAYAEPNYLYHSTAAPNDPSFDSRQWNFKALDLPRAWDINPGGNENIIVAVVDSGITTVNQSFTFPTWNGRAIQNISVPFRVNPDLGVGRLVGPRDFVFGGPVVDMTGHGTHVSSTIGEDTNNAFAGAGIAYNVKIMPIKVCIGFWEIQFAVSTLGIRGSPPFDSADCPANAIDQGIRYAADNGAKVINLSVGGPSTAPPLILRDALLYAVRKGVFVALAAGNDYDKFTPPNPIEYPAAFAATIDGVMAVGAVTQSLAHAYYSSAGSYVEIAAPGGDIRISDRDGIWQTTIFQDDADPPTVYFPRFDRYIDTSFQGTSMASPHVGGIAALLISQGVTNPAAVEALIKATARDLGTPGRDNFFGYGLIQPRTALLGLGLTR